MLKDGQTFFFQGVARVSNISAKSENDRICVWAIGKPEQPIFMVPVDDVLCCEAREGNRHHG